MENSLATRPPVDAADVEHMAALVTGGLLFVAGRRRGGVLGFLFAAAGVGLIFRGQQGYRRLYDALGIRLAETSTGAKLPDVRVEAEVVVRRPREELYRIWRNLENLPVFMDHLVAVVELDDIRSRWVARAPAGMVITWDAHIVNDIENELIAWETTEGSGVDSAGSVHFSDEAGGSTRIRVVLRYDPPAHMLGVFIAKVFGSDPQRQIELDLDRFKRIIEQQSAEVPHRKRPPHRRAKVL
ncbi:MAG TPA: SRPBCC family protein [Fimbriimonadaceae bacterium]|nr:SRPBCC family protein [Fimbriimonadaceae bacterium]